MKSTGFCRTAFLLFAVAVVPAFADLLTLTPPSPSEFNGSSAPDGGVGLERGDFTTALNGFSINSLGIEGDLLVSSMTFTANIYAASGSTRGALLATNSAVLSDIGVGFYTVPINFTFVAGLDYDIAMNFANASDVFDSLILIRDSAILRSMWVA